MSSKRRILFARHGQTDWNAQHKYQGSADVPLNSQGRREAALLAERVRSFKPCRIWSSPLGRAAETAGTVASRMDASGRPRFLKDLTEMNFGAWESRSVHEVAKGDPELFAAWRIDPSGVTPPGGEPFGNVVERVKRAIEHMLAESVEDLLVVCHGGTIRAALVVLLDMPFSMAWRIRLDNCGMTGMGLRDGTAYLAFLNDLVHIRAPGELAGSIPVGEW